MQGMTFECQSCGQEVQKLNDISICGMCESDLLEGESLMRFDPYVGGLKIAGVSKYQWEWAVAEVWQDPNGVLRLYVDSGCSCSYAYERITDWEDIPRLTSISAFATAARGVQVAGEHVDSVTIVDEMRKVEAAIRKETR